MSGWIEKLKSSFRAVGMVDTFSEEKVWNENEKKIQKDSDLK